MKYKNILLIFALLLVCHMGAWANQKDFTTAEKLYDEGQYDKALTIYQSLQKKGESAELFYNMANCYFRMDSIPQALLWYERAYLLNPGDGDIRHNLQYARTKTIDKIIPEEELFFTRWYKSLLNTLSVQGWTIAGIVFFALCLSALCMFFFLSDVRLRKLGFYGAFVLFALVLLSNLFAYQQQDRQLNHDRGIIFVNSVSGKSSPNKAGKELFLLHEGTTVHIIDASVKDWLQIRLPDGKQGWIPVHALQVI